MEVQRYALGSDISSVGYLAVSRVVSVEDRFSSFSPQYPARLGRSPSVHQRRGSLRLDYVSIQSDCRSLCLSLLTDTFVDP